MSRRKQQKPRHLEAENDLAAILVDGTQPRSPASPSNIGDAHVCGKCRAEFFDLSEFLTHKKNCSRKRIVVLYDEDDKSTNQEEAGSPQPLLNGDYVEGQSEGDDDRAAGSGAEDNELIAMPSEKSDFPDSKSDIGSNEPDAGSISAAEIDDDGSLDDMDEPMDVDVKVQKEPTTKDTHPSLLKPELPQALPFPFNNLPTIPDSNVKLATLEGTKVAMAQFAENNLANLPPNTDVATLQTMLFSLHQQQILQLQLLQQLQHQLMAGMAPSMASLEAQGIGQFSLPLTTPITAAAAPTHIPQPSSATTPTISTSQSEHKAPSVATGETIPPTSCPKTSATTPSVPSSFNHPASSKSFISAMSEATRFPNFFQKDPHDFLRMGSLFGGPLGPLGGLTTPPKTKKNLNSQHHQHHQHMSSRPKLQEDSGKAPNVTVTNLTQHSTSSPLKEAGTVLDRSQYAADDPFFKHKCRFCHKVFGSDSGLQIHIRSHTGERPFKCNICGNRFSTRGNLKVHFARHKAKYPHVKMNPHPVPEHLDRINNNPILVAPIPAMMDREPSIVPPPLVSPMDRKPELSQLSQLAQLSQLPGLSQRQPQPESNFGSSPATSVVSEANSPTPAASEAPARSSPDVSDTAAIPTPSIQSTANSKITTNTTSSTPLAPTSMTSPTSSMPGNQTVSPSMTTPPGQLMSNMAGMARMASPGSMPMMSPFGFHDSPIFHHSPNHSILPSSAEDPMEQYMEIDRSETTKLQQLVENIETKLTDPNQCAICHRILSCKSALQMHYRTHTGERPFKCKICGRAFTTKGNLKTHMGVHRAKPPMRMLHQCPVCHKQFTNALVLQQHIRMHTGDLNKEMPLMPDMMPGPHPYMPFPGFPFLPPMYHHPGHQMHSSDQMGNSGELDLRKPPSLKKSDDGAHSEAGSEKKEGEVDKMSDIHMAMEDSMSSAGSSNNENLTAEGSEMGEKEKSADQPMEDGADHDHDSIRATSPNGESEGRDLPSRSSMASEGDLQKGEQQLVSPFSSTSTTPTPTPPSSKSSYEFKPPTDYMGLYSQSSASGYMPPNSMYSTSLMALEERVKAIEAPSPLSAYNSQRPLEQMANILRRQEGQITPPGGAGSSHSHSPGAASQPDLDSGHTSPASMVAKDGASMSSTLSPGSQSSQSSLNSSGHFNASKLERDAPLFGFPHSLGGMPPYKGISPLDLTPKPFGSGRHNTTCNICYKTFACKSALDIHYRSHTKDRPFKCEVCERCFSTRGNMKQHMLTHKIRDLPSQAFNTPQQMKDSQGLGIPATPGTPFKVDSNSTSPPSLNKDVDSKLSLNTSPESKPNISTSPTANITTTPPTPSSGGNSSSGESSQSPFVRRPNPKHVCQMCHKPFSSASALQIHIRTHTGDKPFKCTICGKAFTTKGNLKVHMGTHMWNNSPSRRGRRMSMDTLPGFPGVPTGVPPRPEEPSHFFNNFPHRPPADMYPFFPGFPNGFSPKMNEISVIQSINGNMNHMGIAPVSSASEAAMMPHPPSSMVDTMVKHPVPPPGTEGMMKPPHDIMMKAAPPLMKPEPMMKPDFLMKPTEPHVIKPQEGPSPVKSDASSEDKAKMENNNNHHSTNGGTPPSRELDLSIRKLSASSPPPSLGQSSSPPPRAMSPGLPQPQEDASWVWKTTCHLCSQACSSPGALEVHMKSHMPQHPESSSPKPLMT